MNLDRVSSGKNLPNEINVIIEIPANSDPVKYELDKDTGAMFVDRFMSTAMHYPCNYGYVPHTLSKDGDPVDVERGALFQGSVLIDDNDPFDPDLLDDFEQGAFLWDADGPAGLEADRRESTDSDARPGQDAVENVGVATVPVAATIDVKGSLCKRGKPQLCNGVVPVHLLSTPAFDATTVERAGTSRAAAPVEFTGPSQISPLGPTRPVITAPETQHCPP